MHYLRKHKELLEQQYQGKKKSVQWLIGEHNRLFANWFQKRVSFPFTYFAASLDIRV